MTPAGSWSSAPGSPSRSSCPVTGNEIVVEGVVKAVDAETGRVTVDLTTTCGGEKVLGRCVAVVRLD